MTISIHLENPTCQIICDTPDEATDMLARLGGTKRTRVPADHVAEDDEEDDAPAKPRRRSGRAQNKGSSSRGNVRAAILEAFRRNPSTPVEQLAQKLYGDTDAAAKSRIYATMSALRKSKQLRKTAEGHEVIG